MRSLAAADTALAARLEAAESQVVLGMAEIARTEGCNVDFERMADGVAVFAGVGSPMTHAVGIGMTGTVPPAELERLEAFFRDRGSACVIDLCPLADASVIGFVQSRPYRIVEFNNVLARRIGEEEQFDAGPGVRKADAGESGVWTRLVAEAFSEGMAVSDDTIRLLRMVHGSGECFLAGEEEPVAAAAMGMHGRVAAFFGDATKLSGRRKGWHSALIRARLATAQAAGCDLAMASVLPGSTSHRNYERAGFELIYMRVNIMREFPAGE